MDIDKLRVLARVAEVGSLSRASTSLLLHQSKISRIISTFEREWGERLFHRTGRGMQLTEFGQRMLPRAQALVTETDRMQSEIRQAADRLSGDVGIGLHASMVDDLIGPLVTGARSLSPSLRLRIREGSVPELLQALTAGELDLAVHFTYRPPTGDAIDVLARQPLSLIAPAFDALPREHPHIDFAEASKLPLVLPSFRCELRAQLEQSARRAGVHLAPIVETESIQTMKQCVLEGRMYTIHSPLVWRHEVAKGEVCTLMLHEPEIQASMILRTTTHHALSRSARVMARMVRTLFADCHPAEPALAQPAPVAPATAGPQADRPDWSTVAM